MSTGFADQTVQSGVVPVAVRDFGGDGPPVVLLHGAGGNLVDWSLLASVLAARHRVVAVDLRGHGHSGDGPWEWDCVLGDIAAVVDALGLEAPAVVGMSLGGMAAVAWAQRHPDCPAAVNIEGPARTMDQPAQYDDLVDVDQETLRAELARLTAIFDAQATATAQPLSDDQLAAFLDQRRGLAGDDQPLADMLVAGMRRNLTTKGGQHFLRPSPESLAGLRVAMAELDLLATYRKVDQPLLVLAATRDLAAQQQFPVLAAAYREGLRRDLAAVAAECANVRVMAVDDDHAMVFHQPRRIAELVLEFLADVG